MVAKKSDCTGQRFGKLIVVGKSGRESSPPRRELWQLLCDCGNTVIRNRNSFDRSTTLSSSCGCARAKQNQEIAVRKRKPDCTGQRFGRLVVLGEGGKQQRGNTYRQLWILQCDCGRVIEKPRGDFEYGKQVSCGCKQKLGLVDNKRRPENITGMKFGTLTAIALTGNKIYKKPAWLMRCDCGNTREMSLSQLRGDITQGIRINCRDRTLHPDRWLHYPPVPVPCSEEVGELFVKYLPLTELRYKQIDSEVEDVKRDRLLRAAWIITYRRSQGEEISELRESRYIRRWLRYCSIVVFWKRKVEMCGGLLYDRFDKKKEIGSRMTNVTSNDYPIIETSGINFMLTANPASKHLKFNRR